MATRRPKRRLATLITFVDNTRGPEVELAPGIVFPHSAFTATVSELGSPYEVIMQVEMRDGAPQCRELTVSIKDQDAPPVTGAVLRSLPVSTFLEHAFEKLANRRGEALQELREERGKRRLPKSEAMARAVEEYRRALADLDPAVRRAPAKAVAERLHYARGHVTRLLSDARKMGMLGEARPGRAGEKRPMTRENANKQDK